MFERVTILKEQRKSDSQLLSLSIGELHIYKHNYSSHYC